MTRSQARESAREILKIVPLVMRTVAAELRAAGELPAPAHFGLLTMLSAQPRSLTELASLQGVSLPTMSNSITAMVDHGWVRRTVPTTDRRVAIIEVTPNGRAALERVGRCAEGHLAERLGSLDRSERRRLQGGLAVLREAFAHVARAAAQPRPRPAARRGASIRRETAAVRTAGG
jgi:DNA-binding MarR family transcriptional regulator